MIARLVYERPVFKRAGLTIAESTVVGGNELADKADVVARILVDREFLDEGSGGMSTAHRPGTDHETLPGGVRRRISLTRWSLTWERLWPALLPAALVLAAFVAVVLFDVLPTLSGVTHSVVLGLFAVAFLGTVVWGLRRVRWPSPRPSTASSPRTGSVGSGLAASRPPTERPPDAAGSTTKRSESLRLGSS